MPPFLPRACSSCMHPRHPREVGGALAQACRSRGEAPAGLALCPGPSNPTKPLTYSTCTPLHAAPPRSCGPPRPPRSCGPLQWARPPLSSLVLRAGPHDPRDLHGPAGSSDPLQSCGPPARPMGGGLCGQQHPAGPRRSRACPRCKTTRGQQHAHGRGELCLPPPLLACPRARSSLLSPGSLLSPLSPLSSLSSPSSLSFLSSLSSLSSESSLLSQSALSRSGELSRAL